MNPLKQKQNEICNILENQYEIFLTKKRFNEYLYLFSKFIPLRKTTMTLVLDEILDDPKYFVFFIFGARADQAHRNSKNL